MKIKFGVQHGTNATFTKLKTQDYIKSFQICDKEGYESVFVMDHLNHSPLRAEIPSYEVMAAAAALRTENIKVGSCVCDPHRRHPAQMALDALTMQRVSNNRFILGLGAGEGMNLDDFGVNWNKPATRLIEAVDVIKLLWTTTQRKKLTVDYSGEFFNLKNARLQYPTKVLPKLWIAANGPRLMEFTGKVADGWLPTASNPKLYKKNLEILKKAGRIDEVEKACEVFVVISKDKPDFAKDIGRTLGNVFCLRPSILDDYGIKIPEDLLWSHHMQLTLSELSDVADKCRAFVKDNVPMEAIDTMIIAGSPEDCIEQINDYAEAGVEHLVIEVFGLGNYFTAFDLFTKEVYGYFKELDEQILEVST